ncbi:MAG: T9SS type A sorting domain-containing protein [Bacteroidales bacterium]|nr:T9SS type A sorting domain-containing protein [Bacteroidales bacterium]
MSSIQYVILSIMLLTAAVGRAQFPPAAGLPGSTAISADSSIFVLWASTCYIQRGYMDIKQPELGLVYYGTESDALGKANNQVVSLGDGGTAIVSFTHPICDKQGFDFAVFENSFDGNFLELAFVEISSDSIHWFRFPSVSLTPTLEQISTFGILSPTNIYNLAGKYKVLFGTPFDIEDIESSPLLDKQNIRFVKIIDVIGSIDSTIASFDSNGNIINDPYPTPFYTGGFDLDAVGVIHFCSNNITELSYNEVFVSPNPCTQYISIEPFLSNASFSILDITGKIVKNGLLTETIDVSTLNRGCYFIKIVNNTTNHYIPFVKQ